MQRLKQIADTAAVKPHQVIAYRLGETESYEVGQYSAKTLDLLQAKIAQYPRGTKFSLTEMQKTRDQTQLDDQVKSIIEKCGMVMVSP